jgi:diguanylate cyclase (GGDEF)-like protein
LRRATRILKSAFRPEDMIARVGGDEFVAVLPETDPKSAAQVLRRLKISFKKHNKGVSSEQCVNISIGIATGDKSSQLTDIFKKADQAMYKAKTIKKNSMEK